MTQYAVGFALLSSLTGNDEAASSNSTDEEDGTKMVSKESIEDVESEDECRARVC